MRSRFLLMVTTAVMCSLVLGACSLPLVNAPGYTVFMLNPPGGAVYASGQALTLRGAAEYANSLPAVTQMIFWANGRQVGATSHFGSETGNVPPDSATPLGEYTWTPPAPGEYQIQVQAHMANGRIAISRPNRICVLEVSLPAGEVVRNNYDGPCPPPTPLAVNPLGPLDTSVSMTAAAAPDPLSYQLPPLVTGAARPANCPFQDLTFTATIHDVARRVAFVLTTTDLQPAPPAWDVILTLNETSGPSVQPRTFSGEFGDASTMLSGMFHDSSGNPIAGGFVWTTRALDRNGAVLASDGPHTIPVAPCTALAPPPRVIQPLPTDTPTLVPAPVQPVQQPTLTPTPVVCPKGTVLDPQKNACFYASPTPKPKAADCAAFSAAAACKNNGCSWDAKTNTCH